MRGLRDVLARVGMADSITLAAEVYGRQTVTPSEAVSVRRALHALEALGEVEDLGRHWRGGRRMWATPDRAEEYRDRVRRTFGPDALQKLPQKPKKEARTGEGG